MKIVGPGGRDGGFLASIGIRLMIDGTEAGERFSLVEAGCRASLPGGDTYAPDRLRPRTERP